MERSLHTLTVGMLLSCAPLAACNGKGADSGGSTDGGTADGGAAGDGGAMDSDGDGIPDDEDPTPGGSTNNKLNGTNSGGVASVVAITATLGDGSEDAAFVYNGDLSYGCDSSWYPQGTLCDEPDTTDSSTTSTKSDFSSGATWNGDAFLSGDQSGPVTGILVVDACSDGSCEAVDFNEARVFQMFSDGKTTQLRVSVHSELGDTAPAWNDAGWTAVSGFETIGEGTNPSDKIVEDPTVISTGPWVTRYVRLEARNDGTIGSDGGSYVELRSVKLFSVSVSE